MKLKETLPFLLPLFFSLFIIFYPIFLGFLISPNDIYLNYDPWRYGSFQHSSLNPTLNDPATAYWTKAYLFKTEPESLFFNPYIASGMPGALDLNSGILNPFVLVPLIFPMELFFSLMVLIKVIVSYTGMYLFLKTFNLNKWSCSLGAISYAFFGQNVIWALWPQTNISPLFPWFLYALKIDNKAYRFLILFLSFVFSITGGYPPYIVIFFYFYFFYIILTSTKEILRKIKRVAVVFLLALVCLSPFLYITYYDLKDSGRLEIRENLSQKEKAFPLKGILSFFSPYKFGTPQDFSLKIEGGFHSLGLYSGIFAFLCLPFGFLYLKDPEKRFFIISFIFIFFILFFNTPIRFLISKLPLLNYSSFSRISILLGLTLSIISGFGFEKLLFLLKNKKILYLLPFFASIELGFFASSYFSYQRYSDIKPEETPAISFLKNNLKGTPFRVSGFYDCLWPNSSEYTKIPDIRSHFSSEGWWRDFLSMAYPEVSSIMGTFLLFWDAKAIESPVFSSLFVKYIAEPPFINTIEPQADKKKYIEEPENFIELPAYGLRRKVQFEGVPYKIEFYLKNLKDKVYLNIYDYFSQTLLERYEIQEKGGIYFVLIDNSWEYRFARVYLELFSSGGVMVGEKNGNFCLNISYSPYVKVYDGRDLKIFENRNLKEPLYLIFEAREGFPEREEDFHFFSYFEKKDFPLVEEFLKKGLKGIKRGNIKIQEFDLYGGKFYVSAEAPSIIVLPFKYNPFWAYATLDGKKVKIFKVNGGMSGILIEEGEHFLTFDYGKKFLPFLYISFFLFSINLIIFLFLV
ncbi:MAG: hypothetical protein WHV67_06745 [Thermoanaerobaculia bacterium]